MKFADLRLAEPILRAVATEGYSIPTPIQVLTIPHVLEGRDLLGSAQTGTGKTAAFALPLLHRLAGAPDSRGGKRRPRCLVLCPTRELARQIADSFAAYGRHLSISTTMIFGGVNQNPQVRSLRRGVDVIVATPGRLQDLMGQGHVDLSGIETVVLDEADRMLDMGFIHDIRRIAERLPQKRQTLLFSATMPVAIRRLADTLLTKPVTVDVEPETPTLDAVDQSVYFVEKRNKPALLAHLLKEASITRALVFTRTKHGADRVVKQLQAYSLDAEAIHGNKSQNARERALKNFTEGRISVLIATDVAARGIDVEGISHVINYDLTHEPETYVHRIGRTARAGALGSAVSFCDSEERANLVAIQRLIHKELSVRTDCPAYSERRPVSASTTSTPPPQARGQAGGRTPRPPRAGDRTTAQSRQGGGEQRNRRAANNTGGPGRRRRRSGGGSSARMAS